MFMDGKLIFASNFQRCPWRKATQARLLHLICSYGSLLDQLSSQSKDLPAHYLEGDQELSLVARCMILGFGAAESAKFNLFKAAA